MMKTILPSIIRSFMLVGLVLTHVHSLSFKEVYRRLCDRGIAGYEVYSEVTDQVSRCIIVCMCVRSMRLEPYTHAFRHIVYG